VWQEVYIAWGFDYSVNKLQMDENKHLRNLLGASPFVAAGFSIKFKDAISM
jgi:hypothetical protein